MDLFALLLGVVDFLKIILPMAIILFILAKMLAPVREKMEKKFSIGWTKSCLLLNFIIIFIIIFGVYLYYFFLGGVLASAQDVELQYNVFENLAMVGIDLVRIIVATLLLTFALLFFEFLASFAIQLQEKKKYSVYAKQFLGVLLAVIVFLLLYLFVFNWVGVGLFVYIFYGGVNPLPVMLIPM